MLGDSTPQVLLDTMLYLCGIHFALRSGEEHRSLQLSQFELICPPEGLAGSHILKTLPRITRVDYYIARYYQSKENKDNPDRCLVKLFQKYMHHRPSDIECFYLTPLRKIKNDSALWYSKNPVGHNTLSGTVGRICKAAGISGFKTNHSLRVTSATRLFQSGIDETLDTEALMEFGLINGLVRTRN